MVLQIDAVRQSCRMVARQVRDYVRPLNLSFIIHRAGQRLESLNLAEQELLSHPAGKSAIRLLRERKNCEHSAFLGLATWRKDLFLGLAGRHNTMALNTLNIDEFESLRDVSSQAWHMAWHAMSLYNQHYNSEMGCPSHDGVVLPRYDKSSILPTNLRADTFSALMCGLNGDKDAIRRLAHSRCTDSLVRRPGFTPEDYPFPLAMEATQIAFSDMLHKPPSRNRQIQAALRLAEHVANTYDEDALRQWPDFCNPAQSMAWHGDEKEIILGAAVGMSQNTFVRATGFLVCEITQIAPSSILNLENRYVPFSEDCYTQRLHESMIDRAFESAASSGLQKNNASPFMDAANEQNQKLNDGYVFGWCAAALQAAGRAFDSAMKSGSKTPLEEARNQFETLCHETSWEHLKQLGENIIQRYRNGYAATFSDIIDFCGTTPALAGIASSVSLTMRDPGYLRKYSVSNDARPGMISAFKPATAIRPPTSPVSIRSHNGPGFGFGSGGGGEFSSPQRNEEQQE